MVFHPPTTLTEAEQSSLRGWIEANIDKGCFQDANMRGNRITTRYTAAEAFGFPKVAYDVQSRISETLGFSLVPSPGFKDGMVASFARPGDTCFAHKDPRWHNSLFTVHCNVIVSAPDDGGELLVEGCQHEMPEGKFICYPVSEVMHETLLVKGIKSRLMWVFGFCVSPEQYLEAVGKYQ
jgi:hypothetical protein